MDAPRRCTHWPEDFNRSDEAQHDSRNCSKPGVKSLELIAFRINLTLGGLWVSDIPLGLMTRIYYMGHWWAWLGILLGLMCWRANLGQTTVPRLNPQDISWSIGRMAAQLRISR